MNWEDNYFDLLSEEKFGRSRREKRALRARLAKREQELRQLQQHMQSQASQDVHGEKGGGGTEGLTKAEWRAMLKKKAKQEVEQRKQKWAKEKLPKKDRE